MLLRERHVQPFSRQEEKLDHLDIGRQFAGMQRIGIGQIGIATEQAIDDRRDEAALQQIGGLWLFQRQRGKQRQIDAPIRDGTGIKRVDDVVGLAEPERQPDHQISSDVANDILRHRLGIGEMFRHE